MYSFMLTSFHQHFDGEIRPCYSMKFYFISSHCCIVFHCVAVTQFIHSTVDGSLGCCQLEVIMNSVAMNILAHVF